jgi:hypothetical protein
MHLVQLLQSILSIMATQRVIQDSDDSDGNISDIAASIDRLQHRSVQRHIVVDGGRPNQSYDTRIRSGPDEHVISLSGSDHNLGGNFDNLSFSQDRRLQISLPPQQYESLWLRENGGGHSVGGFWTDI